MNNTGRRAGRAGITYGGILKWKAESLDIHVSSVSSVHL